MSRWAKVHFYKVAVLVNPIDLPLCRFLFYLDKSGFKIDKRPHSIDVNIGKIWQTIGDFKCENATVSDFRGLKYKIRRSVQQIHGAI